MVYESVEIQVQQPMGEWVTFLTLSHCGEQECNLVLRDTKRQYPNTMVRAIDGVRRDIIMLL